MQDHLEVGTCDIGEEELIRALKTEKNLILATCADNHASVRPMSHIHDGLDVLFQTCAGSLKVQQIAANPRVALCIGTYQIEGVATVLGNPMAKENAFFAQAYRAKHRSSFKLYSGYRSTVVVRVRIHRARQWRYIGGKPFLAEAHFLQKNTVQKEGENI